MHMLPVLHTHALHSLLKVYDSDETWTPAVILMVVAVPVECQSCEGVPANLVVLVGLADAPAALSVHYVAAIQKRLAALLQCNRATMLQCCNNAML